MARPRIALVVIAAICGLGACVTERVLVPDPRPDRSDESVVDADVVARAAADTAALRGLPFLRPVPVEVMDVAQLEAWLNRYYDQYMESLRRQDLFYHKMGILPPTRDSASMWKGFLGDFAGGVYDDDRVGPDGNKGVMILVSDYAWWSKIQLDMIGLLTGKDLAYEVFLAHELTHALQDQHFQLGRMLDGGEGDNDRRMVAKTVLESEANVVGMAHFAGMRIDTLAERKVFFAFLRYNNWFNAPLLSLLAGKTPSFFRKQTFAQYELGLDFVEQRLDDGEWRALLGEETTATAELARAWVRRPGTAGALPASTEQLLFPEKIGLDPPLRLPTLPFSEEPVTDAAGAPTDRVVRRWRGLVHVDGGVFGALALKHWLEQPWTFGVDDVVKGWGGDRWDVFLDEEDAKATSPILLWRLRGDDADEAAELFAALVQRTERKYGAERLRVMLSTPSRFRAVVAAAPDESRRVRTVRDEHVLLERRGAAIVVVDGLAAARFDDAAVAGVVDDLFAASAPVDVLIDDAPRRTAARALEEHLRARAPPTERADLAGRLVLPWRTMAMRAGVRAIVADDPDRADDDVTLLLPDVELRWGLREHLELSLPLGLTLHTRAGPALLAVGARPLALPLFHPVEGAWSARLIATGVLFEGPIGALVQVEGAGAASLTAGRVGPADVAFRAGLVAHPVRSLLVQPALELADVDKKDGPFRFDGVRIGGVAQRGFLDAPLVELEVLPGLFVWGNAVLSFRIDDGDVFGGWTRVAQDWSGGLLVYF